MKLSYFLDGIIEHYRLKDKVDAKGFVYVKIMKGMYGLPHAGIIAQKLLEELLNKHCYHQSKFTPGLWTNESRPICFSLVVDGFGVKYVSKEDAQHLMEVLEEHYTISKDWKGERCNGITLDWGLHMQ